jgi:hypothetical protein
MPVWCNGAFLPRSARVSGQMGRLSISMKPEPELATRHDPQTTNHAQTREIRPQPDPRRQQRHTMRAHRPASPLATSPFCCPVRGRSGPAALLGRIPWPPREISGEEARPGPDFSGHNEGAAKCTGPRARPEPCAAKPEPPDHRARGSHESGSRSQVSYSSKAQEVCRFPQATSNARRSAPHLVPAGCIAPAGGVGKATIADGVQPSKSQNL